MKEQNFSPSRESGTSFENDGRIDLHAGNSDLISYEELTRRRQQQAFEHEAIRLMNATARAEQGVVYEPYEGRPEVIGRKLAQHRRDEFDLAA
ncbi:MAG TPA: hypothetical protein VL481_03225 [Verrucomicrobiae bacterium]|nr:hypothetical protein [Verrucomicrobiae bacterium]